MKLFAAQTRQTEVTLLALLETAAAAAVTLWLALRWNTFAPFAFSVIVAPLLLTKTRDSTAHGIRLARKTARRIGPVSSPLKARGSEVLAMIFGPFFIRVWATTVALIRDLPGCVMAIPPNWINLVARIDSSITPQVVPGYRSVYSAKSSVTEDFWHLPSFMASHHIYAGRWGSVGFVWTLGHIVLFIQLPAIMYRWTLKSTFWIYLPLIWVVHPARYDRESVWARISIIRSDKFVFYVSAGILFVGAMKIRIWQTTTALSDLLNDTQLGRFFYDYVSPDSMPVWQYASMFNSALAIAMFFIARAALQSHELKAPWPEGSVDVGFKWATVVRRILTTYTTLVLIMITIEKGFPPIGEFLPG